MMHAWTKGAGLEEYKETVDEWAQRLVIDPRWNSAAAKDDTDDMMKQLTEGIKGAASSHFSKVSVEGKYKRSEKTETLYEKKQQLRDEARRLKMQPFSMSVVLRGWQCMARLQRKDKELGKSRRADRRARTAGWAAEMHPARWRGDWCEIWRLARCIAGTGLGPKRRTYGDVAPMQATAAEMARYLEQEGPAGGCRLQVVMEVERADEIEDPVAKACEHKRIDKDDLEREIGSEQEDVELGQNGEGRLGRDMSGFTTRKESTCSPGMECSTRIMADGVVRSETFELQKTVWTMSTSCESSTATSIGDSTKNISAGGMEYVTSGVAGQEKS